jgi:hypothetical protein
LKTFLKIKFKNLKKKKKKKKEDSLLKAGRIGALQLNCILPSSNQNPTAFSGPYLSGFFFFFKTKDNKKLSYINLRKNDNFIMPK